MAKPCLYGCKLPSPHLNLFPLAIQNEASTCLAGKAGSKAGSLDYLYRRHTRALSLG